MLILTTLGNAPLIENAAEPLPTPKGREIMYSSEMMMTGTKSERKVYPDTIRQQ